jgi:hypothetical protein
VGVLPDPARGPHVGLLQWTKVRCWLSNMLCGCCLIGCVPGGSPLLGAEDPVGAYK